MNVFNATGNIGRDVEVKNINGTALATFSVAVKAGYGNNEKKIWIRANLWGKRAESGIVQYLVKGQLVGITGELSEQEWQKQDGSTGHSLELRLNDVTLLGKRDEQQVAPAAPKPQPVAQKPAPDLDDDLNMDVPF